MNVLRVGGTQLYSASMLAELTVQLAALPERAWPRFSALHAAPEALPHPLRHVACVSSISVLATGCGWVLRPGATLAGVVLHALAAVVGYLGGAAVAIELSAVCIAAPDASPPTISRFASGAVLPVAVSGIGNLIPFLPMSLVLAFLGAAASVHSGWIGASAMLALEGKPRKRAAAYPAGVAVGLVLLATLARTVLPT
jgi:hypothetical protein